MQSLVNDILNAGIEESSLFYLGQAGYVLKSKQGTLLGIDLYLTECVERIEGHDGFKRLTPKLLSPNEVQFDYLLTSHRHFDHFDVDAIPILLSNKKTQLYASTNCKCEADRLMLNEEKITYMKYGDKYTLNDIEVESVLCDHGPSMPDSLGFIINVNKKRIYFTGDTCLRLDQIENILKRGKIDILIAPINGSYGNMDEKDCVELCRVLRPNLVIPCHFGTFISHGGDAKLFLSLLKEILPEQRYLFMALGEKYII